MEAFLLENLPILLCFLFGVALLIVEVFLPASACRASPALCWKARPLC